MYSNKKSTRWMASSIAAMMITGVIAGCSAGTTPSSDAAGKPKASDSLKGEFTLWSWDADHPVIMQEFKKKYPDIKVKVVNVQAGDVPKKLQTTIASGGELPDVIRIERNEKPRFLEMDALEDLTKPPYNVKTDLLFDYDLKGNQNAKGEFVNLPEDITVAGLGFQKDLTKQYLGTDDPKQLESMLTTWDTLITKAKEASQKSDGKVKAFASLGDVWMFVKGQRSGPYFDGDKLNTSVLSDSLAKLTKFRDAGIVDKLDQFTPAWNATFGMDKYMFYPTPVWLPQYIIAPNDKTGKARWGLMVAPEGGYIWGGSGHGIPKGAKNKELAFKWIEFVALTQEGAEAAKKDGVFTHYKKAYDNSAHVEWKWPQNFGEQNIGEKFFKDISPKTKDIAENTNDKLLFEAMDIVLKTLAQDASFTADKALEKIKQEVKAKNAKIIF